MKLLPAALVLLVPAAAHADRRGFAHTYEYQTQAEATSVLRHARAAVKGARVAQVAS